MVILSYLTMYEENHIDFSKYQDSWTLHAMEVEMYEIW